MVSHHYFVVDRLLRFIYYLSRSELDSEITGLKSLMSKQVKKEETLLKRSVDDIRPILIATKKARTEHVVQSETTVKESYPFKGISKEEFHKLSRENQILSQVCIFFVRC